MYKLIELDVSFTSNSIIKLKMHLVILGSPKQY